MGREEQIEEREVLDSIFPDEITGIALSRVGKPQVDSTSTDISETSYKVTISLDIEHQGEEADKSTLSRLCLYALYYV